MDYSRGSEWRRWDLHVHTRTSYDYEYNGDDADDLLVKGWNDNAVAAVAITDHFTIDPERIRVLRTKAPDVTIFPGVELRTDKGASNVHVILIFSDDCCLDTLAADFDAIMFRDKAKNQESKDKIYWDWKDILEFSAKHDALISLHAGRKTNGVDDRITNALEVSQAIKEEYAKDAHIFEVGKIEDVEDYRSKVFPDIHMVKPLVLCSDNHDPRTYGNKIPLWIKADPTFNGLKQIIFEPEERIQISETKPQEKSSYQVIESITIHDDRFQTEPILFNDKLTCIIGAKSSGKSILLHNLACAIASKQVDEKYETITGKKRSDKHSKPLTLEINPDDISVKWADGNDTDGQTIVYIPQTYLNRLADSFQETTEIDAIIEKVLLDRKDINGNLCREKKAELISHVKDVKSKNTNSILEIISTNNYVKELAEEITELGGKAPVEKELKRLQEEREKLSRELNISEDDIKKYDEAIATIDTQNDLIKQLELEISQLLEIMVVAESCKDFSDFSDDTKPEIQVVVDTVVQEANSAWNERKTDIIKRIEEKLAESKSSLDSATQTRDQLKSVIESSNRIKELAERINAETEKLKTIKEKEALQNGEQKKIDELIKDVAESYVTLREDYEEFAQYITENTRDDSSKLKYDVQIPLRRDDFLLKWSELYRAGSQKNRDLIKVDNFTDEMYKSGLLTQIISKTLKGELDVLKAGSQAEVALRAILDDWFNIKYVVQLGNDKIDVMSPGKKALVLLQLLIDLADSTCPILIDQPEDDLDNRSVFNDLIGFIKKKKIKRQIIVATHNANVVLGADAEEVIVANQDGSDTPKKERRFEYRSGAIENDYPIYKSDNTTSEDGILNREGIQQHICSILEGGSDAFEKRKNKYQYMVSR